MKLLLLLYQEVEAEKA
jgi:hypothetical protein